MAKRKKQRQQRGATARRITTSSVAPAFSAEEEAFFEAGVAMSRVVLELDPEIEYEQPARGRWWHRILKPFAAA